MRPVFIRTLFFAFVFGVSACERTNNKPIEEKPAFDIAPQRAQLQKAKELEKKIQQDAEDQRKAIEVQTNSN